MQNKQILMFLGLIIFLSKGQANPQENRIALIIGNSEYSENIGTLNNPSNDAKDMAEALRNVGFDVTSGINLKRKEMFAKIIEFSNKLREGDAESTIGLFYYAGHGMEFSGTNYLLPVDTDIEFQDQVSEDGVELNRILALMTESNNRMNIVILDSCRNNPLPKKPTSKGRSPISGGWSKIQNVAQGMFIAYGTSEGRQALDGVGRNGVFTKNLLKNINTRGLLLEQVFKKTRQGVLADTNGTQLTEESNKVVGDFYFIPPSYDRINTAQSIYPFDFEKIKQEYELESFNCVNKDNGGLGGWETTIDLVWNGYINNLVVQDFIIAQHDMHCTNSDYQTHTLKWATFSKGKYVFTDFDGSSLIEVNGNTFTFYKELELINEYDIWEDDCVESRYDNAHCGLQECSLIVGLDNKLSDAKCTSVKGKGISNLTISYSPADAVIAFNRQNTEISLEKPGLLVMKINDIDFNGIKISSEGFEDYSFVGNYPQKELYDIKLISLGKLVNPNLSLKTKEGIVLDEKKQPNVDEM